MPVLKADPDWLGAAQDLVSALEAQPDEDGRVEVVLAVREALGDQVYPAFVKLLAALARFGDAPSRRLAADAFAHALATSKLPAVRVPAFGGGGSLPGAAPAPGGLFSRLRAVGPIEFLCVWACRDVAGEPLAPEAFETALGWLVTLFDSSPRAAVLYQARLAAQADDPVEGLHDHRSRAVVRALLAAWEAGRSGPEAAAAARGALREDPFARLR